MVEEEQKPIQIVKPKTSFPSVKFQGNNGLKTKLKNIFSRDKKDSEPETKITVEKSTILPEQNFFKSLVKFAVASVLVLFLLLLFFRILKNTGTGDKQDQIVGPTPTEIALPTKKPSVYAEDEVVTEIEKKLNTLDADMSDTDIKESILYSPKLDFKIDFKTK